MLYLQFVVPESFPEAIYLSFHAAVLFHITLSPTEGKSCVTDIPHCNYTSGFQILFVPISIFKVFFLLLHLENLPFHGPILTENKFLLSDYGAELNWVFGALWLTCKYRTMLKIWPLKHVTQLTGLHFDLGHLSISCAVTGQWARFLSFTHTQSQTWIWLRIVCVIVTQANYFPCCFYRPVKELLNTIVWSTKHEPI